MHPLKAYRKARGLTMEEFARKVGVQRAAVSKWERGSIPRPEIMRRIVEVTGGEVTAQDFYDAAPARAEAGQ